MWHKLRTFISASVVTAMMLAGCDMTWDKMVDGFKTDETRLFSPDKVIAAPDQPSINPIMESIGVADTKEDLVPNATFPCEDDYMFVERDYTIGAGDVVDVSVLDLFQEGVETILRRTVSERGYIELPLLGRPIKALGQSQETLSREIALVYERSGVLKKPVVSVNVSTQKQNIFSALGAIARPGTYGIIRKDMRLLEALALAGGIMQPNVKYLYIIRQLPGKSDAIKSDSSIESIPLPSPVNTPASMPSGSSSSPAGGSLPLSSAVRQFLTEDSNAKAADVAQSDKPVALQEMVINPAPPMSQPASAPAADAAAGSDDADWTFKDGKWVQAGNSQYDPEDPFGWIKRMRLNTTRIIAISVAKLNAGDPRMNIVIRNNDVIQIPMMDVGEFYVAGEVQRPGAYSLTGRKVTIKMALAAAGNFAPLAWPNNSMLIRRVGNNQEQIVPVDVEAIFKGKEADIFLRNDDVIAVGSDIRVQFYAVFRNAFRMTYGFGFIYDRNFADPLYPADMEYRYTSDRFTHW